MKEQDNIAFKIAQFMIIAVTALSLGILIGREYSAESANSLSLTPIGSSEPRREIKDSDDLKLFWEVWNTLENQYVDEDKVEDTDKLYGAIKGMVNTYDDGATVFLDPEQTEGFKNSTAGSTFSGIGAELAYEGGQIVVVTPIDGSPAIEAGLRAGDLILGLDGEELEDDVNIFEVVSKIRGEAGTDVTLSVFRPSINQVEEIKITRGDITVPSMDYREVEDDPSIAVFDISRFTEKNLVEWQSRWDDMVDQFLASDKDSIVIDLRGNPGGFFNAATYAASEFLQEGDVIVKQKDRQGDIQEFKVTREGRLQDVPVIVLVNEGSASSSEILSGALQLNGRTEIVGVETFGKGTAQDVLNFGDGSSLHLTIVKWLLPDGNWINPENPIVPDHEVERTEDQFREGEDPQLEKAVDLLK